MVLPASGAPQPLPAASAHDLDSLLAGYRAARAQESLFDVRGGAGTGYDEFLDAALKLGAESLHAPRLWPEYHPGYFGAFVRDPDGNNVEAVFHGAAPSDPA